MEFGFIGGAMGSAVGEVITRAAELAAQRRLPLMIISASGGVRMQEGCFSLMQMAKTSAALALLSEQRLPCFVFLTDPTYGGVSASFATLGDILIAEPDAMIGFAGRSVIESTIKQQLPKEFQLADFLLEHGMIDMIVPRGEFRRTLAKLLTCHCAAMSGQLPWPEELPEVLPPLPVPVEPRRGCTEVVQLARNQDRPEHSGIY